MDKNYAMKIIKECLTVPKEDEDNAIKYFFNSLGIQIYDNDNIMKPKIEIVNEIYKVIQVIDKNNSNKIKFQFNDTIYWIDEYGNKWETKIISIYKNPCDDNDVCYRDDDWEDFYDSDVDTNKPIKYLDSTFAFSSNEKREEYIRNRNEN